VAADLQASWEDLLSPFGAAPQAIRDAFADLATRHAEPHRHYHTLPHIAAVLRALHTLCPEARNRPALLLAGWFHDAVYNPQASDNEQRSAELAHRALGLLGVNEPTLIETARLILLTRTHQTAAEDRDGQVLLDADLAILGADQPTYDGYAHAIRQEYAWVPEEQYCSGRRRVLQGFLARTRIYYTPALFAQAEARARANLAREIAALADSLQSPG
jgi:predicted metal-dependent HD superfamily phosphohydrolase